ncbi:MAG: PilZ domain-containing protein [Acidiferrobacterales bacterium]
MTKDIGDIGTKIDEMESIERRASTRQLLALRVSLYYDRLGLITCKTRDISIEGMLLDTGRVRLSDNTQVEVVLTDRARDYSDPIRVQARVSRVQESLAALTFLDLEISAFRRLKTLLSPDIQN